MNIIEFISNHTRVRLRVYIESYSSEVALKVIRISTHFLLKPLELPEIDYYFTFSNFIARQMHVDLAVILSHWLKQTRNVLASLLYSLLLFVIRRSSIWRKLPASKPTGSSFPTSVTGNWCGATRSPWIGPMLQNMQRLWGRRHMAQCGLSATHQLHCCVFLFVFENTPLF